MKAGDTVMIYEDPLTERKSEGKALLVSRHSVDGPFNGRSLEHWKVRFINDDDKKRTFFRTVLEPLN